MNITEQDYNRRINHIFVNKTDNQSVSDSISVAKQYIEKDARKKVFVLPDFEDISKKIGIGGLASSKRGIICGIERKGKTDGECLDFMTYQTKFGLLILTDENLGISDHNVFLSETFLKKSVDVIMHKSGLLLNPIETKMLQNAKKELIDEKKVSRNIVYKIYPDETFTLSKELYKQMFAIYGHIDSVGIILTQMFVNSKKYGSFAYYNFFFRELNEINNHELNTQFENICSIIGLDDKNKSLLYEKLFMKNMELPKEIQEKSTVADQTEEPEEQGKVISMQIPQDVQETITDEQLIDKQVDGLLDEFLSKIDSGELSPASMFTQQEKIAEMMMSYYEPVCELIDNEAFFEKFKNKVMSVE